MVFPAIPHDGFPYPSDLLYTRYFNCSPKQEANRDAFKDKYEALILHFHLPKKNAEMFLFSFTKQVKNGSWVV